MTSYNGERWVAAQIDSVLEQQGIDVDLIVSDDGSSDQTPRILDGLQSAGKLRYTVRRPATGSASQNFFALIDTCPVDDYAYFAFSDQDDVWDEDKLQRAHLALLSDGSAGYSCAVRATWPDGRTRTIPQVPFTTPADFLFEGAGQGCTFVMTRDFFLRIREFLPRNRHILTFLAYHDWTIYALARCWNLRWTFDPQACMTYRQHDSNDTGAKTSWRGIARRLSLIRSGWYARQLRAIAELCVAAAPGNSPVAEWLAIMDRTDGLRNRFRAASFCCRNGRRAARDNAMLITAALAGWLQVSRTGPRPL
jgi:rhamnosyltransferase